MENGELKFEVVLADVERHCNNYFNEDNDPVSECREYPKEFLALVERIAEFRRANPATAVVSESVIGLHSFARGSSKNGVPLGWQAVFAVELSLWKRVRFV